MSEAFDPRPPSAADGPSERLLDAYVTGEATPAERAAVDAWMAADPHHRAIVETRQSGFAAFAEARPQVMLARIRQGLAEAEADAARRRAPVRPRWTLPRWLLVGGGLLAGAAAALLLWLRPPPGPSDDSVRLKGDLALRVFRARGDAVDELLPGDTVTVGDTLRFRPDHLPPPPGQLLVAGVEASGALFAYQPADGRSRAVEGALDADGAIIGASVLDASTGREKIWLVWCPAPFELGALTVSGDRLTTPTGCRAAPFALDKR